MTMTSTRTVMRAHLISCLVLAIAVISRTVSATLQTALDVAIRVDTSRPISTTDDVWSCANLDWWSHNKCDYGNCPWGEFSLLNVDLKNTLMRNAMAAFGGKVHLRLGGSLADFVVYNVPGSNSSSGYCKWPDFSLPTNSTRLGYEIMSGCLEMSRWDDLNAFCDKSEANCSILFGINALFGRTPPAPCPEGTNCRDPSTHPTCCTDWSGAWDLSNAEAFLRYTKEKGHPIYAFEFGNELVGSAGIESHISVEDYVADWRNLVQLINRVYGKTNPNKPLTVVPDTSFMSDWYDEFLRRVMETDPSARPDIVTHHLYSLGAGVNVNAWQVALNATVMNNVASLAKQVQKIVKSASPTSKIWVGEAGGCYNSGSNNVTNAFNSGFWYLDQMAVFAQNGHGSYCRQTLAGGYYSLLDANTFEPNPDYYSLLTWSKVMDKNVLQVSRGDSTTSNIVRVYSHCMGKDAPGYQPGGVSLVIINLSNSTAATVDVSFESKEQGSSSSSIHNSIRSASSLSRQEYIFSSACNPNPNSITDERTLLACKQVLLNGNLLHTTDNQIPAITPLVVDASSESPSPITLQPLTYGFVSFPSAKASACM